MTDSENDLVKKGKGGNGDATQRVAFDYIKSQHFRVIHADGAIGAVTPNGHIHIAFFSERQAIPRRMVHKLTSEGELGPIIDNETVTRASIVREMDVDVFVNLEAAKVIHTWLSEKITALEKQTALLEKPRSD